MAYENDAYRDEEGEPLVDFDDDVRSEGEQPHDLFDDMDDSVYDRRERFPTPVLNDSSSRPRKKKFKVRKSGGGRMKDHEADPEMKEMWDTIAGDNSEDDQEGVRNLDDDNFIDDTGVDPSDRYASDREHSPSRAPEAEEGEEDDEIKELFKVGRKKRKEKWRNIS